MRYPGGLLPGPRRQAHLSAGVSDQGSRLLDALTGCGAQIVTVDSVDYARSRICVSNSNGPRYAWVRKDKSSGLLAGDSDMPNEGDVGVFLPLNGDKKSGVWIGALNGIDLSTNIERDENYPGAEGLVHRAYKKHETGSFFSLDKLGNFLATLFKKTSKESDPRLKNLDVSVSKDGVLSVTHYRGSPSKPSVSVSADQSGNLSLTVLKDDGVTNAITLLLDKTGSMTVTGLETIGLVSQRGSRVEISDAGVNVNPGTGKVSVGGGSGEILYSKVPGATKIDDLTQIGVALKAVVG